MTLQTGLRGPHRPAGWLASASKHVVSSRFFRRLAGVFLLAAGLAQPALADDAWRRSGDAAFEELVANQGRDFARLDRRYREARELAPDDKALAMARCDFYWSVWDLEGVEWAEDASSLHEDCLDDLTTTWPDDAEARLFVVEQRWGEDGDRSAEALWRDATDWPKPLRARLAYRLSNASELSGDDGDYAVQAVRLGHPDGLVEAIEHLTSTSRSPQAVALARGAPLAASSFELDRRLNALLKASDPKAAQAHLRRHAGLGFSAGAAATARSHLKAGDLDAAAASLANRKVSGDEVSRLRMELALARGDVAGASKHYKLDSDDFEQSLVDWLRIVRAQSWQAILPALLPTTLVVIVCLIGFALTPLPLLALAHYRGLARRVANRLPVPIFPGIGLRHAWYAVSVSLVVPAVVIAMISPDGLVLLLNEAVEDNPQLFSDLMWGNVATLVALLPLLYWMRRPDWLGVAGQRKPMLWTVPVTYLLVFGVGLANAWVESLFADGGVSKSEFQDTLMKQGPAQFNVFTTFLMVAVITPVMEEWLFRGALLGGLSRHISFGWANVFQAAFFMSIHTETGKFPFYFAMGLAAGWLVRRHRCLLPAIALHMLNNGVATALSL